MEDAALADTVADDAMEFDEDAVRSEEVVEDAVGTSSNDESVAGQAVVNSALQPADIGRDLIFTATVEVVVDDVAAAGQRTQQAMETVGGLLFGQQTSSEPRARSVLTFKVPPRDFATALERLGQVGEVRDQHVTTDDVTDRLVDLASQIRSIEVSVERLRAFLTEADSVGPVARQRGP